MAVETPIPPIPREPDIDAGVIEDASARQRRHQLIGSALVAVIVAAGALTLGFGGGAGASRSAGPGYGGRPGPLSSPGSSSRAVVLMRNLLNPQAYAVDDRLWVIEQTSRPGSSVIDEIMSVNPSNGRILASRHLGATYDQALLNNGVLWVTTNVGRSVSLWRLAPNSLKVISKSLLPGSESGGQTVGALGTMAVAGGWLWVGGWDTIDRFSSATAQGAAMVRIAGAQGIDVASNASGTVLVDSEGHEQALVQRRNPSTGRLLDDSPLYEGVTKPYIGGVSGSGIWLTEATGMMGYAQRISIKTLRPTHLTGTPPNWTDAHVPLVEGTNGISSRVTQNILWITQDAGGKQTNYCGDPENGKPRAVLPLANTAMFDSLLTVATTGIYYVTGPGVRLQLNRAPINPTC